MIHLLFHWGKKRVTTAKGYVADFCPVCRAIRCFKLVRVGNATHFNHIALNEGELVGYRIHCCDCAAQLTTDAARYIGKERSRKVSETVLINKTFPKIREYYRERLEREANIRQGRVEFSGDERFEQLIEPFDALSPEVEERFAQGTHFDVWSSIGCFGTMIVTAGLFFFGCLYLKGRAQDHALLVMLFVGFAGIAFTLLQLYLSDYRFLNGIIATNLARSLRPLRPTEQEIKDCLQSCRDADLTIGRKLKFETLWQKIKQARG